MKAAAQDETNKRQHRKNWGAPYNGRVIFVLVVLDQSHSSQTRVSVGTLDRSRSSLCTLSLGVGGVSWGFKKPEPIVGSLWPSVSHDVVSYDITIAHLQTLLVEVHRLVLHPTDNRGWFLHYCNVPTGLT